jgi:hypothetical protein
MNHKQTLISLFASTALLGGMSGCGGGSDTPAPPPPAIDAIPPSASSSPLGLKNYLADLSTMTVDNREPLDLGSFVPPTSDTTEPEPVS